MSYLFPSFSLLLAFLLGITITKRLSIVIPKFSEFFFSISLGCVLFTAINFIFCLIFSFPTGVIISQITILVFEIFYINYYKYNLNLLPYFYALFEKKLLIILVVIIGIILFTLFNHHVLFPLKGDLYSGESTYGDLPFHLSTISSIAYGLRFPPDNPMYVGKPLVYPYLINFFSAILVYEGLTLRESIIIPGIILSFSLTILIFDFAFFLTKDNLKSFLAIILYLFNGGFGFYFFLNDYSFSVSKSFLSLLQPVNIKEYSHLFEQNIQWPNFLSRMIVPERSILFGLPIGIIILRLLFFNDHEKKSNNFDLFITAFLLSLLPLLHTHTALVMAIILPVLTLFFLKKDFWKTDLKRYLLIGSLAVILAFPLTLLFINHLDQSNHFIRLHFGWMKNPQESFFWFWFKNSYILIPLSLAILLIPKAATKSIKALLLCAFILFIFVNIILLSPYDWDNVKFLFWAGLFLDIAAASVLGYLLSKKALFIKLLTTFIIFTMVSSALLSIWREINISFVLFSKEAVELGEQIKKITPKNAIFLTYKTHNSPINNLAGRPIMMGFPGLLWVHGINYQEREKEINQIFQGKDNAINLIQKNNISFVVLEDYQPNNLNINREFFNKFPILIKNNYYTVYQVR